MTETTPAAVGQQGPQRRRPGPSRCAARSPRPACAAASGPPAAPPAGRRRSNSGHRAQLRLSSGSTTRPGRLGTGAGRRPRDDVDAGLAPLRGGDRRRARRSAGRRRRRSSGTRSPRAASRRPASSMHDPVPAEGDAAVRRRAVGERVEQEAELLPRPPPRRCRARRTPAAARRRGGYGSSRRRSRCRCRRCRRRRPAPRPGDSSNRSIQSAFGEVNGWCTAVQATHRPRPRRLLEHRRVDDPEERPGALVDQLAAGAPISSRAAPSSACASDRGPRRRRCSRPAAAPVAAARPARSASERFLATGPPSVAVLARP